MQELEQDHRLDSFTEETPERKVKRPRIVLPDSIISNIIANENAGEDDQILPPVLPKTYQNRAPPPVK